jgi:hypothetical protein
MSIRRKKIAERIIEKDKYPDKPHIYLSRGEWVFIRSNTISKNAAALKFITDKYYAR